MIDAQDLKDMVASAFEEAMAFGVSRDNFERLANTVAKKYQEDLQKAQDEINRMYSVYDEIENRCLQSKFAREHRPLLDRLIENTDDLFSQRDLAVKERRDLEVEVASIQDKLKVAEGALSKANLWFVSRLNGTAIGGTTSSMVNVTGNALSKIKEK